MKYFLHLVTLVFILLESANSEQLSYTVNRANCPAPKFFSQNFDGELGHSEDNTNGPNIEIDKIPILLQELSYNNRIVESASSTGYKFLKFIPTENARNNETILLFSNSSRLNLSESIRARLSDHGDRFLLIDLSTLDANTEEINTLLSFTKKIKVLIMPIIGKYQIEDIDLPKNLVSLVVYNQKVSQRLFARNQNLENLVMWGCDMPALDAPPLSKKSSKNLSKITLINCGLNLLTFIQNSDLENLKEVTIDEQTMLWRMIERKSVEHINFYTYRSSGDNRWSVSLLSRNFNKLRPIDSPIITINIFDQELIHK